MSYIKKLKAKTEQTAKKTVDVSKTVGEKGMETGKKVGEKIVDVSKDAGARGAEVGKKVGSEAVKLAKKGVKKAEGVLT